MVEVLAPIINVNDETRVAQAIERDAVLEKRVREAYELLSNFPLLFELANDFGIKECDELFFALQSAKEGEGVGVYFGKKLHEMFIGNLSWPKLFEFFNTIPVREALLTLQGRGESIEALESRLTKMSQLSKNGQYEYFVEYQMRRQKRKEEEDAAYEEYFRLLDEEIMAQEHPQEVKKNGTTAYQYPKSFYLKKLSDTSSTDRNAIEINPVMVDGEHGIDDLFCIVTPDFNTFGPEGITVTSNLRLKYMPKGQGSIFSRIEKIPGHEGEYLVKLPWSRTRVGLNACEMVIEITNNLTGEKTKDVFDCIDSDGTVERLKN